MHRTAALAAALAIALSAPAAHAELYDLVVELGVGADAIEPGGTVEVAGAVLDHAYRPVAGAAVRISAGADTAAVTTGANGTFAASFEGFGGAGGTYVVNVSAVLGEMTGQSSAQFRVSGDGGRASLLAQELSTDLARGYLGSSAADHEGDPVGQALFAYYGALLQELIAEKRRALVPDADGLRLEEERRAAADAVEADVEKYGPGSGTYGGYQLERYVSGLPSEVRGALEGQLNFTRDAFEDARHIREAVIAAGGTHEDAQAAYLERLTMPREVLELFTGTGRD